VDAVVDILELALEVHEVRQLEHRVGGDQRTIRW